METREWIDSNRILLSFHDDGYGRGAGFGRVSCADFGAGDAPGYVSGDGYGAGYSGGSAHGAGYGHGSGIGIGYGDGTGHGKGHMKTIHRG